MKPKPVEIPLFPYNLVETNFVEVGSLFFEQLTEAHSCRVFKGLNKRRLTDAHAYRVNENLRNPIDSHANRVSRNYSLVEAQGSSNR